MPPRRAKRTTQVRGEGENCSPFGCRGSAVRPCDTSIKMAHHRSRWEREPHERRLHEERGNRAGRHVHTPPMNSPWTRNASKCCGTHRTPYWRIPNQRQATNALFRAEHMDKTAEQRSRLRPWPWAAVCPRARPPCAAPRSSSSCATRTNEDAHEHDRILWRWGAYGRRPCSR